MTEWEKKIGIDFAMIEPIESFTYDPAIKSFSIKISEIKGFDYERSLIIFNKKSGQHCRFKWFSTIYNEDEIVGWSFVSKYKIFYGQVLITND